ncbi:hypothetical protein VPH35_137129 [Triticum aestivum]|uniref:protein FAR-RED ELONGATED HYPOCOTYL 3 isoform X1 n=1 Tax=Triticum aestivum TaxID=4565 RepID=UPI000DF57C48|nr:protein FAR-RED ELONGATED HYPOCOTYL 3-like isoform X1 [Triticum aestivum]XP_044443459.1 protein FAR-RED ELONGATED HYPOCOTYL 3-like isoform X1 [Triticum aestivum]XP_044443460.1 protein FAR-RED ELONGATED HYPOCOTYL 3-like isoform X1 [Triticum aestivum]XP_044443461.1 protein FAR-RED ELONGATED HYPOCOTYL 3-like isoform X1 [Triticum aestivum]
MTSTQQSESANHMLKNYVPPACPMNVFVKQYGKLQYDREQEEGFQEKRTRLGGAVIKSNLPIERHARKIYTRTMFEMFGRTLYVAGYYFVEELEPKIRYVAIHGNPESMDLWFKTKYEVVIAEDQSKYSCECGRYEHMGMICSHILKVMIILDVKKIPQAHIMKRWTLEARDVLPDHIKHYQRDMGPPDAMTFRHSAMYITKLEIVHLGDSNPEAFEYVMNGLCDLKQKAMALNLNKDGLSVIEKSKASSMTNSVGSRTSCKTMKTKRPSVSKESVSNSSRVNPIEPNFVCSSEVSSREVLLAPERRLKRGYPTTSRDKAPYEDSQKRTRFGSVCRGKGHKSTTCPQRGDLPVKPRKEPLCSNCKVSGHRKNSCSKKMVSFMEGISTFPGLSTVGVEELD